MGGRVLFLFTYGTLTSRRRLEELLKRVVKEPRPASLKGFRLFHAPPLDYPLILPDPAAEIAGLLYEVSEEELPILDRYEGLDDDPPPYTRQWVEVACEGDRVRAQVYVGNPLGWPVGRLEPEG